MQKALDFLMNLWYNNLSFGGIAQLGERLNGIQEVRGSTPLISTKILGSMATENFYFSSLPIGKRLKIRKKPFR